MVRGFGGLPDADGLAGTSSCSDGRLDKPIATKTRAARTTPARLTTWGRGMVDVAAPRWRGRGAALSAAPEDPPEDEPTEGRRAWEATTTGMADNTSETTVSVKYL